MAKNSKIISHEEFEDLFDSWLSAFGLIPMEVVYDYIEVDEPEDRQKGWPAVAVAYAYPYQRLIVRVYPMALDKQSGEGLRRSIMHELCHVMTWKLRHFRNAPQEIYDDIEEEVMEKLAFALTIVMDTLDVE